MSDQNCLPSRPHIACVDDDEYVREALEGLLTAFGYSAETFATAEEFLSSGRVEQVSCLVTDLQLGGMSGVQLQRRLIELGTVIPTIIITAFGDERLQKQAIDDGAVGFLYKPITQRDLLSSIRVALDRRDILRR